MTVSTQDTQTQDIEKARKGLQSFIAHYKRKIGLSKSSTFNESLISIALQDNTVVTYVENIQNSIERTTKVHAFQEDANPWLISYLRGIKQALIFTLQTMRKAIYSIFGADALQNFDSQYNSLPLVENEEYEIDLCSSYVVYLKRIINSILDNFVYNNFTKNLFYSVLNEIESAETFSVSNSDQVSRLPSIPFNHKKIVPLQEIFDLFNTQQEESYIPEYKEKGGRSVFNQAMQNHELAATVNQRKNIFAQIEMFVVHVAEMDQSKNDSNILEKCIRARQAQKEADSFLTKSKKVLRAKSKDELKKQMREQVDEAEVLKKHIVGYVRGAVKTLDIFVLERLRTMSADLHVTSEFSELLIRERLDETMLKQLFKFAIIKNLNQALNLRLLRFIYDLRNEGVVKEFNDRLYWIGIKKGYIIFQLNIALKKNLQKAKLLRTLLRICPDLEKYLISCVSLAPAISAYLMEWQKKDPAKAMQIIGNEEFMHTLGELIHIEFSLKGGLQEKEVLRNFFWHNRLEPMLIPFIRLLAKTRPAIKAKVLGSIELLDAIWSLREEGMDKVQHALENPLELDLFETAITGQN